MAEFVVWMMVLVWALFSLFAWSLAWASSS